MAAAVVVGAFLRLDQFTAQVLIDDEWHAVHQVLRKTPAELLLDFGYADYSIPLGLLYWFEARWFGLSESLMRAPMLLCGLATLVAFPLYVARRMSRATALTFAFLLALSPLLVIYSRMARPYAITLLLGWVAHVAFQRWHTQADARAAPAFAYGAAATLATWLHPIVGPFVLAPFLWGAWQLRHAAPALRRARFVRLAKLALATGAVIAALVLPPLIANPHSMALKSGIDMPNLGTAVGVWYAWLGTPSTLVVLACVALAVYGAADVAAALPEARTGLLGILLTLVAVLATRPMWSYNPIALARYLLPVVPLLLLGVAAGAVKLARRVAVPGTTLRRGVVAAGIAALPCVALAAQSPLVPLLRHPNGQALHFMYHFDFRDGHNPYLPHFEAIPLSPFWAGLAAQPPGSVRIAAAPFYFESFNWDAPRWEAVSRQAIVPGFLTGLCSAWRGGEVPQESGFRLRNAVHLAAVVRGAGGVDYVVWQKPYTRTTAGGTETIGSETANCEAVLRARLGPPAYEDATLVAFDVRAQARTDAAR